MKIDDPFFLLPLKGKFETVKAFFILFWIMILLPDCYFEIFMTDIFYK